MNDYQQLVSLVSALLSLPSWHSANVAAALRVELTLNADDAARGLRVYVPDALPGFIRSVEFIHPTYSSQAGWKMHIRPIELPPEDPAVALAPLYQQMAPAAAPIVPEFGRKSIRVHNRTLVSGDKEAIFSFVGQEYRGPQSLRGITMTKPRPSFAPERSSPERYRAYSVREGDKKEYIVEFMDTREEAIRVNGLAQLGRTLEITFRCVDPFLDSKLAFRLLRKTLLGEHLGERYEGKLDTIRFKELNLPAVGEPWKRG
jgi:hypothetical protein